MGSRVGSAVGAVMDTKNKVRDSASSLKENVKDLPTQAGYAVHSAKQKAKDNVSDFKRGVVEERENRQEQHRIIGNRFIIAFKRQLVYPAAPP